MTSEQNGLGKAAGRWWALALLTAIYTCHTIDRQVVAVVMDPVKHEFKLSDGQVGFLGGMAHAIGFALTVVPFGLLADRTKRSKLLATLVAAWSGLTMLAAFAVGPISLAFLRMGVGAAEGGASSNSTALIADYFDRRQRGLAYGVFYSSTAIGIGLIFLCGGYVAGVYGWRATFFVAGLPGMALGLLAFFTLREPTRGGFDDPSSKLQTPPSFRQLLSEIASNHPLALSIAGLTTGAMTTSGIWAWSIAYFTRIHGISIRDAGLILAIALGAVQTIGLPVFGRISDGVSRGRKDRVHLVTIGGLLASVPATLIMVLSPSLPLAVAGAMLLGACTAAWLGQAFGSIVLLAPLSMRGSVFGTAQLCSNLLGTGLGPLLVGMISDVSGGGGSGLKVGLVVVGSMNIGAAALLGLATRCLRRAGRESA
jgi:MFS family permease